MLGLRETRNPELSHPLATPAGALRLFHVTSLIQSQLAAPPRVWIDILPTRSANLFAGKFHQSFREPLLIPPWQNSFASNRLGPIAENQDRKSCGQRKNYIARGGCSHPRWTERFD